MTDWSWTPPPELNAEQRMIDVGEAPGETHLETVIAGPKDSGRIAVCLHGFPELNISWRHQIPLLAEKGYRVYAPNLRGYGASSRPKGIGNYHIDKLTADVGGLMDAARAEAEAAGTPATEMLLMAHDWGGAVAWDFAINRVRPIDRLVMCNMPHPATFVRALRTSRAQKKKSWYILFFQIPKLPEWLLGRNGADPIRRVFRDTATNPDQFPPEVLDVYANAAARPGALTAMINYYRAAARSRGRMAEVGDMQVDTRTLLIWGTGDTALGMETVDGIEDYVPNIRKEFLPGISHWVQQDAPAEVNALIADWLAAQDAA